MLSVLSLAWVVIIFAFGVSAGLAASRIRKAVRTNPWKGRRGSAIIGEVVSKLELDGKIQLNLSPADNAAQLLESVLSYDLDDFVRASVVYALDVLKSDFTQATVPVGLSMDTANTPRERQFSVSSNEGEGVVLDWLLTNYTPKSSQSQQNLNLKCGTHKVKLALNFHDAFSSERDANHSSYINDVSPEKLAEINSTLEGVDEWDWVVWKLHNVTNGRPLQTLGWHLLHKWDLVKTLKLNEEVLRNWLIFVEMMYEKTEYHSSTHAADVLQAVHHFLCKIGVAEYLSTLHIFSVLVTAIIHDVGHDGKNNLYHENALTERALMFNDQSIQENFHCMTVFSSMSQDSHINILAALGHEQAKEVRRLVILMTLGTDMKNHFKHFQKFKSLVSARGGAKELWTADPEASDELCANILHAADLSNPCRRFDVARQWASRVLAEFFAQGDREKKLGLPVSPMCSRDTTLMPASQIGFINFVVLPYFQVLGELFPRLGPIVGRLEANLQRWRALEAEEGGRAAAAAASASAAANAAANGAILSPTAAGTILQRRADLAHAGPGGTDFTGKLV